MEIKISLLKNWKFIPLLKFNLDINIFYYLLIYIASFIFCFSLFNFLSINIFKIEIIYRITPIYKYYLNLIPSLLK